MAGGDAEPAGVGVLHHDGAGATVIKRVHFPLGGAARFERGTDQRAVRLPCAVAEDCLLGKRRSKTRRFVVIGRGEFSLRAGPGAGRGVAVGIRPGGASAIRTESLA